LRFFTRMVVWVYPSSPGSKAAAGKPCGAAPAGMEGTRTDSLSIWLVLPRHVGELVVVAAAGK
jgi:hypothetical protein